MNMYLLIHKFFHTSGICQRSHRVCLTPRLTPSYKRDKKVLIIGAGEGIRTLDFNLGNDVIEASYTTLTLTLLVF